MTKTHSPLPALFPALALGAVVALTATSSFAASQSGTVVVNGQSYQTITREFDQQGRTVVTGEVRVRNIGWGCNTLEPGDCEDVVQRVLDSSNARLVEGAPANPIRQIIGTR